MRFIIFVIDNSIDSASGDEMAAINAYNDGLRQNGHFVMAAGIGAPSSAHVIDNRSGVAKDVKGSLFPEGDFYSGFWIIDADTPDIASRLARAGSQACNRRVELRPFLGQ